MVEFRYADIDSEAAVYYGLMRQLRPHLASGAEFTGRWRRQAAAGYRLMGLWHDGTLVALAGFRVLENLVHGVHLYIDDLVTAEEARSRGFGSLFITRLEEEGRSLGCAKLLLDTPLANLPGHRFYYRNGMLATAFRFTMPLGLEQL